MHEIDVDGSGTVNYTELWPQLGGSGLGVCKVYRSLMFDKLEMCDCEFFFPPERNCIFFLPRFIAANISKKQYLQEQVCFLLSCFRGTGNGKGSEEIEEEQLGFCIRGKAAFHIFDVNGQIPRFTNPSATHH